MSYQRHFVPRDGVRVGECVWETTPPGYWTGDKGCFHGYARLSLDLHGGP